MKQLSRVRKFEMYTTLVILVLAFLFYLIGLNYNEITRSNFWLSLSAIFIGTAILFFLLNRLFEFYIDNSILDNDSISAEQFLLNDFDDNHIMDRIAKSKKVYINGVTLSITSQKYFNSIEECLKNGGEVKVLVIDYTDGAVIMAASKRFQRHQNVEKVKLELSRTLSDFTTLRERNPENPNIQIRLSKVIPSFGIWAIDGDKSNGELWVRTYSNRGDYDPAMKLLPHKDGKWYDYFKSQFENLWKSGNDYY